MPPLAATFMKISLLYWLFFVVLFSCNSGQDATVNNKLVFIGDSSKFISTFFTGHLFCYNENFKGDSTKVFLTSSTYIKGKKLDWLLRMSNVTLKNDTLQIVINDSPFKNDYCEVNLKMKEEYLACAFHEFENFNESKSRFETFWQRAYFDKKTYKNNDSIKAVLYLRILEFKNSKITPIDTINIKAEVKAIVR